MSGNTEAESPYLSHNEMDRFDKKMNSIMQSSISTMFRQLIEPVDSNSGKLDIDTSSSKPQPPPLKLHDFGGSDFVRLAEKSRRNRSSAATAATAAAAPQQIATFDQSKPSLPLSDPTQSSIPISKQASIVDVVDWNKSPSAVANDPSSRNQLRDHSDWKCTQECIQRTDGYEETRYPNFTDGTASESLHHALYPNDMVKDTKKSMIVSSPSTTSSLSSMADSTKMNSPLKRLWHLVFD
ncbi:hypothetical protein BCR42DRAFT_496922 [Absidia repens]|uniref:Uncharacterized protein n=1 Tax=Absidia repens TaxID=90262 RepID=A0A1X2HZB6_9FUNG|nr:hypothetical protein BCR42DRAFT_496922 [Absidia repens]